MKIPASLILSPKHEPARALYAGSFDPWSEGHQFVLENGLSVFSEVHVVLATNPSKKGFIDPLERMVVIASAGDPFQNWFDRSPPFSVGSKMKVDMTEGLVVEYAREHGITHLLRGLRSTTDFESEFNLYFSNRVIFDKVQTWTLMCPPELLHCSSTYVKTVVGKCGVSFVGTSYLAQALMTRSHVYLGQIFDLIRTLMDSRTLGSLQLLYSSLSAGMHNFPRDLASSSTKGFWERALNLKNQITKPNPKPTLAHESVTWLWSEVIRELTLCDPSGARKNHTEASERWRCLQKIVQDCELLGFSSSVLFDRTQVEELLI